MGIYIWTFAVSLVVPLSMVGFGAYFMKHAPKEINYFFGYRTRRSMMSRDTWEFAHKYCGRLWLYFGLSMIPADLGALALAAFLIPGVDGFAVAMGVAVFFEIALMFIPLALTERALDRNFDRHGRKK